MNEPKGILAKAVAAVAGGALALAAEAAPLPMPEVTPTIKPAENAWIKFDPSQMAFFLDDSRVIVVCWHRQKGKDFCAAAKAVTGAAKTGQDWFIYSLTQRQADATFAKCKTFFKAYREVLKMQDAEAVEGEGWEYRDDGFKVKARELVLPNGARIIALPGRDPDAAAGLTGNVIFTEFGLFPNQGREHWRVVFPLATRGFQVIVISTPRDEQHKFKELVDDKITYSVHFCDIIHSVTHDGLVLKDNKGQPCTIEQYQKLYNDPLGWSREYMCRFCSENDALLSYDLIRSCEVANLEPLTDLAEWANRSFAGPIYAGYDIGRTHDRSVLWADEYVGDVAWCRVLIVLKNCTYPDQIDLLRRFLRNRSVQRLDIDKGMMGGPIFELMAQEFGTHRVEGVQLTDPVQEALAMPFKGSFEERSRRIPVEDDLREDLHKVKKVVTAAGNVRLRAESDDEGHADRFWAGALAKEAKGTQGPRKQPLDEVPVGW